MNKEFKDVHFQYKWNADLTGRNSFNSHPATWDIYDNDYQDDHEDFDDEYKKSTNEDYFLKTDFSELIVTIEYYWERTCSLGCKHKTKRFKIINAPKLLDILTFFRVGAPARVVIKEHFTDFFYDPIASTPVTPAKTRKKKVTSL